MILGGEQKARLRKALLEAFPTWGVLQVLVDDRLNERLQNISAPLKPMPEVAHDLIGWAQSRGRIAELVMGAVAENPGSPELNSFAAQFKIASATDGEVERIVFPAVPFENVAQWLEKLSRIRRAVGRFESPPEGGLGGGYGTAFLVARDVVLTNHHVIKDLLATKKDPGRAVVRFDYEIEPGGAVTAGRTSALASAWDCGHSAPPAGLDYALVRLAEPVGDDPVAGGRRGFIQVSGLGPPAEKEPLMVLQHPHAMPLKLSIGSVVTHDSDGLRITYNANTLPGSSGSPCLNSALDPVALHFGAAAENRGARLDALVRDLKNRGLDGLLG